MVDRAYKGDLPRFREALEKLREDFSKLDSGTDWTRMRIEPLLEHLDRLEKVMDSPQFAAEFSRLRSGVAQFHSDLVYFRTNIQSLRKVLESEKAARRKRP